MIPASRFHSISWKFLIILIPAITLAAMLTLVVYTYIKFISAEENVIEKVEIISDVHSLAVAHPLWTLDFDGLNRSIQTIALHPEIACVYVKEMDSNEQHEWPVNCVETSNDTKLLSKSLTFGDQDVGQMNLIYTNLPQQDILKREFLTGALFFFLLVSVAGVVAYLTLQYTVGRPLRRLIVSIKNAEHGDDPEAVVWSTQDELGSVITAYNKMIHQVSDNTRELVAAREQAESATYTKGRFLANMSHELRTPLNAVIGITEMLREEAEEENNDTEPYDRVAMSGRHLLHLIDDILDFSKIEAGKINILIEEINLDKLIDEACATVRPLAENRGNRLELNLSSMPAWMMSDAFRLRQILINLLSNACKFTRDGTIWLDVSAQPVEGKEGVHFSVRDTGIGISKEQGENLFLDFSQADISTTRQYGGTGLGLAISQRLCELLGGKILLQSTLGKGSEFSFTLLMHSPAVEKPLKIYSDSKGQAVQGAKVS